MKTTGFILSVLLGLQGEANAFEVSSTLKFLADDAKSAKDHWAVIVAGSKSLWNYRHQADAAHAYSLLKKNGIPEDQIIYMSYDDVPYDDRNPIKGQLFNKKDGENVYFPEGIDYRGDDVTADNFYAVLKGDSEATQGKPVLGSDSNSKVFVFFTDHGAPGIVQMPAGDHPIYADELQQTIDFMESHSMYDEMVFYIEACESGSMFPLLRKDQNVYAVTASNATQSSYATYCSPDNTVNGVSLVTCLGDEFSVAWMEDTESHDPSVETLGDQFEALKKRTKRSPVQMFGEDEIESEFVGFYLGTFQSEKVSDSNSATNSSFDPSTAVDSRDAKLVYLETLTSQNDADEKDYADLRAEKEHREQTDLIFSKIFAHQMTQEDELTVVPKDFDCLRDLYNTYEKSCEPFEDYSLKYVKNLVHSCETESFGQILTVKQNIEGLCSEMKIAPKLLQ